MICICVHLPFAILISEKIVLSKKDVKNVVLINIMVFKEHKYYYEIVWPCITER